MTAPRFLKLLLHFAIALIILMLVTIPGGCRFPWGEKNDEPLREIALSEVMSYTDALDAYHAGDYAASAQQFESIRETTTDEMMSRMALYGLACAQLMTAETPGDYREAVSLWELWVHSAPPHRQDAENPALLAPVIKEKMIWSFMGDAQGHRIPIWLKEVADNEVRRLRRQLEEVGNGIDDRDKKIKLLEREISRLQEQIQAFETIDQKVQKRKHSIPSAD
jgi:TolA-binding protein